MAQYTQQVAQKIVETYQGDVARIWNDGADLTTITKAGIGPTRLRPGQVCQNQVRTALLGLPRFF